MNFINYFFEIVVPQLLEYFKDNANGKFVISKQIEACGKIEAKKLIKTLRRGYNSDIKN